MTRRHSVGFVMLALAGTLQLLTSCAAPVGRLYVEATPPAPIVESHFDPPAPGYIWLNGYHRWDGDTYAWVPGRWGTPPQADAKWAAGRWQHDRRGWYFVEGHWKK